MTFYSLKGFSLILAHWALKQCLLDLVDSGHFHIVIEDVFKNGSNGLHRRLFFFNFKFMQRPSFFIQTFQLKKARIRTALYCNGIRSWCLIEA